MRDRSVRLFWTFILSVAAVNVAVFWGYIVDDAYISFRYLNNLLEGNGLVFNPGERLESFSNFIWIAILIPFSLAGVPLILSSRIAGALFFLGTILLGKKIIDQLDPQAARDNNLFLAFLIASCPHLGFWATGGLETVAFSFFICSSIHLALRDSFALSDRILLPLSCFFLTLCRPEGAALAVLCYGYKSWQQGRSRAILGSVVLLLVLVLAMLGLRYVYYGEFLPHTFFSKSRTTLESLPGAFSYSFGALSSIGGVAALLVPIVVLYKFRKREIWFLFSILAFYLAFQFRFGWDWMPFFRFAAPYLPLVFIVYVLFCRTISHIPKARIVFISAVVLWMVAWSLHYLKDGNISAFYQPEANAHAYYKIAHELNEITDGSDYVLYEEMGLIPFYCKAKFIDAIGLTDKFIGKTIYENRSGKNGVKWRYFALVFDYVKAKSPKVIILPSNYPVTNPLFAESLKKTWPYQVFHSSWFKESYHYLKAFRQGPSWYHLYVENPASVP